MREVTEMTQIKLLVVMPVPEDQRGDDTSCTASFSGEVNAILRFDGGWRLTMSGTDYPRATEEGTELAGAADDPPVKEAVESLARAAIAEPEPEADAADGTGADADADVDRLKAHTRAKVLELKVPEGSNTVQVRLEPEVFVEDGEPHVRVKVNDPGWVTDTGSSAAEGTSSEKETRSEKETGSGKDTGSEKETRSEKETGSGKDTGSEKDVRSEKDAS
jgi:hypothetical protein